MNPYTVLIMPPDSDDLLPAIWWIEAEDPQEAIKESIREYALSRNPDTLEEDLADEPDCYLPLAVFEGHLECIAGACVE